MNRRALLAILFGITCTVMSSHLVAQCQDYGPTVPLVAYREMNGLKGFVADGDLVYAIHRAGEDQAELLILDVSTPEVPETVGRLSFDNAQLIWKFGDRVYIRSWSYELSYHAIVVDVLNPSRPRIIGRLPLGMDARDLAVYGEIMVVANNWESLLVFDISNLETPEQLSELHISRRYVERVQLWNEYLLIDLRGGSYDIGVVDIADPAHPQLVATHTGLHGLPLGRVGDLALSRYGTEVRVHNFKDPLAPVFLNTFAFELGYVRSIHAADGMAVIAGQADGVRVLDTTGLPASLPGKTIPIATSPRYPRLANGRVIVNSSNWILQVIDPAAATPVNPPRVVPDLPVPMWDIKTDGQRVFAKVGGQVRGLYIGDFDPVQGLTNHTVTFDFLLSDYELQDGLAYVTSWRGFEIIDVTPGETPRILGELDTPLRVADVAVDGDLVYLAHGFAVDERLGEPDAGDKVRMEWEKRRPESCETITLVDVSDPATPQVVGTSRPIAYPDGSADQINVIAAHDGLLFVAVGGYNCELIVMRAERRAFHGQARFDIKVLGRMPVSGYNYFQHIEVADGVVHLTSSGHYYLIDYHIPHNPRLLARYTSPDGNGSYHSLGLHNGQAFLGGISGVTVVDISDPRKPRTTGFMPVPDPIHGVVALPDGFLVITSQQQGLIFDVPCGGTQAELPIPKLTPRPSADTPAVLTRVAASAHGISVDYRLDGQQDIELVVYDLRGAQVCILETGVRAGSHTVVWGGRDSAGRRVADGVYFMRLRHAAGVDTRKAVLIR